MPDVIEGLTREPKHVTDARVRGLVTGVRVTTTTAITSLAVVKTTVDAAKTAGLGMDDTAVGALQTQVNTAVTDLAAVVTAIDATGL